jgi:hypothetical protein
LVIEEKNSVRPVSQTLKKNHSFGEYLNLKPHYLLHPNNSKYLILQYFEKLKSSMKTNGAFNLDMGGEGGHDQCTKVPSDTHEVSGFFISNVISNL